VTLQRLAGELRDSLREAGEELRRRRARGRAGPGQDRGGPVIESREREAEGGAEVEVLKQRLDATRERLRREIPPREDR
jgi:hypothetical protein